MTQASCAFISPTRWCRLRAFRAGYEDFRAGRAPRFGQWGHDDLAYEDGRQVAAWLAARGEPLRPIPLKARLGAPDLRWLKFAKLDLSFADSTMRRELRRTGR